MNQDAALPRILPALPPRIPFPLITPHIHSPCAEPLSHDPSHLYDPSRPYDPALLADLWEVLRRAERRPSEAAGLVTVPFTLDRNYFNLEFRLRVTQWYRPREGDVLEPFGNPHTVLTQLRGATLRWFHLSCCGIQVPSIENSVLSLHYEQHSRRYWTALPGLSYHVRNP